MLCEPLLTEILAERYCISAFGYCRNMLSVCSFVVCCLPRTRVYCDKTAKARITGFSMKVGKCLNFQYNKFDHETLKGCPRSGAQTMVFEFGKFATVATFVSC